MKRIVAMILCVVLCIYYIPCNVSAVGNYADFIANTGRRDYVNSKINAYLAQLPELHTALDQGKPVVFVFEGASDKQDTISGYNWVSNRVGAVCIVLRKNGNAITRTWYSQECSTLPDRPLNYGTKDASHGPATIVDGVYDLYTKNHKNSYAAFNVRKSGNGGFDAIYLSDSGKGYDYLSASGINTHGRTSPKAASSDTVSPWSTGCILMGTSKSVYDSYLLAVNNGTNGTGTLTSKSTTYSSYYYSSTGTYAGKMVVDRVLAENALVSLYKNAGAVSEILRYSKGIAATVTFDVNGYLDGVTTGAIDVYGTFDVWMNGTLVADNVTDYCADWPVGTSYEITDIQATGIHKYLGLREGSLSGTVGNGNTGVRLQFRTIDNIGDDFYAYIINKENGSYVLNQGDHNVTELPYAADALEEIWNFQRLEDGTYKITSAWDGYALDVENFGNTPGTNVHAVEYKANTAQHWCVFQEDAGCILSAVCTPCVLYGNSSTTNVQMENDRNENTAQWFQIVPIAETYSWDVSGFTDGKETAGIDGYGTFDIWLDGVQVADDVPDFFTGGLKIGTKYEIRDIRVKDGRSYNGVHSGSLSGTICGSNCFTLLDFSNAQVSNVGEPEGEATLNGRKYVYYPGKVSWYTAKAFCEEQGGHLVTVTSAEEEALVQSLCGGSNIWLGGTDAESEGNWTWITGEAFEYSNWMSGEPNNAAENNERNENYLMKYTGGWNDIYGSDTYGFVCEFEQGELKLGGYLDGQLQDSISGYGTVDVYIDGALVADDVSEYSASLTGGSTYEICDVKPADGYSYSGIYAGARTGTIKGNDTTIVLEFTTVHTDNIGEAASVIGWNGKTYAYYSEPVTWYSAKAICEKLGGHLVTVNSEAENQLVLVLSEQNTVWAGGTDSAQELQWRWITDETFEYTNWKDGEPNDIENALQDGEDFLELSAGGWNDVEGCRVLPFVCEYEEKIADDLEPEIPTLTLKAPTLEFKDMITVNAMFTAENIDDVVEMGMITYTEKVDVWNVETADHVISGTTYDEITGRYIATSQGIHAKYLGDTVYLATYAKLTDGSYVYSKLASYSPVQYATSKLSGTDTKLKQLVVAMLNYGAAAQTHFGHNTGNLANATLTAEQIKLPEAYRSDMVSTVASPSADKQGAFANNKGFTKKYPSISFEGAFCINYFFTPSYAPVDGITLYYWNAADYEAVDVLSIENASGSFKMDGEGTAEYRSDILGISAKDLSKAVYVAAVYSDGTTTWTSGVLGYSIGAYCASQSTKGGTIADLAMATAVYGYQAKQYFG